MSSAVREGAQISMPSACSTVGETGASATHRDGRRWLVDGLAQERRRRHATINTSTPGRRLRRSGWLWAAYGGAARAYLRRAKQVGPSRSSQAEAAGADLALLRRNRMPGTCCTQGPGAWATWGPGLVPARKDRAPAELPGDTERRQGPRARRPSAAVAAGGASGIFGGPRRLGSYYLAGAGWPSQRAAQARAAHLPPWRGRLRGGAGGMPVGPQPRPHAPRPCVRLQGWGSRPPPGACLRCCRPLALALTTGNTGHARIAGIRTKAH